MNEQKTYAEYLLKNHRFIRREVEIMEMDIQAAPLHLREGVHLAGKVGTVCRLVHDHMQGTTTEELANIAQHARNELKKLEIALTLLPEPVKGVIKDIYITGLNWQQICNRRFISANTLNRRRHKGLALIGETIACKTLSTQYTNDKKAR